MIKSRLKSLELEYQEMKSTICKLKAESAEAKTMLSENHMLISAGNKLSELKPINRWPSPLDADRCYAMDQSVIPKGSPEEICLWGGFIVGGILEIFGINNNKIIYGIPNYIPSP